MITFDQLTVAYPDGTKAIDSLSVHIEPGETVALIGANGAGKSSLLLSMVGILLPSEGSIQIDATMVIKKNSNAIREKVGMVFQNPDDQLFLTRVYDDVAFGIRNCGCPEADIPAKVEAILDQLGILHLKERSPSRLSGGEKRSAALASVLVMQPQVLLFDEPTSFLDPKARRKFLQVIESLPQTKILATHDLDMALDLCDRVLVLQKGHLFADGAAQTILTNTTLLEACGLELPFRYQSEAYF